ncbi:hypothetical protein NLC35_02845 [Candidatus Aminicenantes bacterium AC-334-K16]|jgi:hypothetical protein|nr:hypothetical protein [Candidatus Aminicenantes bacterium AC-334-K16]
MKAFFKKPVIVFLLTLVIILAKVALAETSAQKKKNTVWGKYYISGYFGSSYLVKDVQGNLNLFRSQFNLKEGLNVEGISLRADRLPQEKAFLDSISLSVQGFGAEPYGLARITLTKRNVFTLVGNYTERKFFLNVDSVANPLFDSDQEENLFGSFHTWNSREKTLDLTGIVVPFPWFKITASWQRTKLEGNSLITLYLLNNQFPLNEPLNQISNLVQLSGNLSLGNWLSYELTGLSQSFDLEQTASSDPNNLGIKGLPWGKSSIYLTSQSRQTIVEAQTKGIKQFLFIKPLPWLSLKAKYLTSRTEGDSQAQEEINGQFIWPLYDFISQATLLNAGKFNRRWTRGEAALQLDILPRLYLTSGFKYYYYRLDNEDTLNVSFFRSYYQKTVALEEYHNPFLKLAQKRYYLQVGYYLTPRLGIRAGLARTNYSLEMGRGEAQETSLYHLDSYSGSVNYKLSKSLSFFAAYDKGAYDFAFARLIPLKTDSLQFKSRFKTDFGLTGSLLFRWRSLQNDEFSYSSEQLGYGLNLMWQSSSGKWGAFLNLNQNDLDSIMDIIQYTSLFTESEDVSRFKSKVSFVNLGGWFKEGIFSFNGGFNYTEIKGTFPGYLRYPYLELKTALYSGISLIVRYRYYQVSQKLFRSQNYKAHLLNLGAEFAF